MLFESVMAGFGGQGILYMGDILAQAAVAEGRRATFFPTYGAAMRGGTANCVVIISDREIGAPLMDRPHAGVFMNQASLVKFERVIEPGGIIVLNSSIADPATVSRKDLRVLCIPATELAARIVQTERVANIVMLGALIKQEPVVNRATLEAVFAESDKRGDACGKNLAALDAGYSYDAIYAAGGAPK